MGISKIIYFTALAGVGSVAADSKAPTLLSRPSHETLENFEKLLQIVDTNSDGSLTRDEVHGFLSSIRDKISRHSIAADMANLDKDKDGLINFDEIKSVLDDTEDESILAELKVRYAIVDKNKDGFLDLDELSLLVVGNDEELREQEHKELLKAHDKDKNDTISLAEFQAGGNFAEEDKEHITQEFLSFDLNGDGELDREELMKVMSNQLTEEINKATTKLWEANASDAESVLISDIVQDGTRDTWLSSAITDHGEILKFPESYELELPHKNIEGKPRFQSENGGMPEFDESMFGDLKFDQEQEVSKSSDPSESSVSEVADQHDEL